ncbi:GNAT family N-acetyltransferase [Rhizobium ruizarguesonis]|uniref:GNAT family N-acetyltransferase n=1 Tax=Rhizobium ruizarguesonis TaxID=2081791 RepID=UPI001031139C|nr:GNAT family N-acetyltransferase [Rhizobium ruizarguesonis]TAY81988.1 GNAT family N-acetyltransferase [Rhizobium ruizarguesonis]
MIDPLNFDCIFRPAAESDYDNLHHLLYSCWMETYGRQVSAKIVRRFTNEDCVGEHLRLFLNSMHAADVGGRVVGVINQTDGCITALNVAKEFRRIRIGFSLLHNAYMAGGRRLSVGAFNVSAIRFYECCGWRKSGRFFEDVCGVKIPALLMTR